MLSLFSGIGGIDLAAHWAGFQTVAFCEREPFCRRVLARHWPGVPCFDDIHTLDAAAIRLAGIHRIDIVAGGWPCQPYSLAGKGKASEDPRALWPEMRRLIDELRPFWVLGENVPGHLNRGLDDVLLDLDSLGYEARVFVYPAEAVGACHRRERIFVVAHDLRSLWDGRASLQEREAEGRTPLEWDGQTLANLAGLGRREIRRDELAPASQQEGPGHNPRCGEALGHPGGQGLQVPKPEAFRRPWGGEEGGATSQPGPGPAQPGLGRDVHGLPAGLDGPRHPRIAPPGPEQFPWEPPRTVTGPRLKNRVSRIKALGNAVDPYQVFPILAAIRRHLP